MTNDETCPSSFRLRLAWGIMGGMQGFALMNDRQSGPRNVNQGRAPAAAGEHPQRATGGWGLLSDRACLGTMAAVVVDAFSARLREEDGRTAAGRLPRCAARGHRSAGPEVLPQCLRLLLGGGRRSIPLAEVDSPGAVGCGRIASHGRTAAGSDHFGGRASPWWYLALPPAVVLGLIVYFFRSPRRRVPQEPGLWVSPADGTIAEITQLEHDDFVGGPAVRIGIFLVDF